MNLLARFRDWWFAPVVSRLDRIEATQRPTDLSSVSFAAAAELRAIRHDREAYRRAGYSREEC